MLPILVSFFCLTDNPKKPDEKHTWTVIRVRRLSGENITNPLLYNDFP